MSSQESKPVPLGMRELQPNPSNYIAEALVEHGVTIAFGIHGGHIWQIVDEISRAGIKTIILPEKNETDLEELASHIKEGLNFEFVQRMDEVVNIALS